MPQEYEKGYKSGYKDGFWYGKVNTYGDLVLEAFPPNVILPGYTISELMKTAIESKKKELKKMITAEEVYFKIVNSLDKQSSLSLVRLGDGEGIALAQGYCKTEKELLKYDFLKYAGISTPDYQARDELAEAVKKADIIGIPASLMPDFQPLVCKALQYNGINIANLTITPANIHQYLFHLQYFKKILQKNNNKIVLIGNLAGELAQILRKYCNITGVITPVNGIKAISKIIVSLKKYNFNLLLVAAGIPAVIICSKAAAQYKCVALDIGHLANKIVEHQTLNFNIF